MRDHTLIVGCTAGAFTKLQHETLYDTIRTSAPFDEMIATYVEDEAERFHHEHNVTYEEMREALIIQIQHYEFCEQRVDAQAISKALPALIIFTRFTDHGGAEADASYLGGEEITFEPKRVTTRADLAPMEILTQLRVYARTNKLHMSPQVNPTTAHGLEAAYAETAIRYRRHWSTAKHFHDMTVKVIALDSPPASYLNRYREIPYTAGTMQTLDGRLLRFHCQYQNAIGSNSIADAADFHKALASQETLQISGEIVTTKSMPRAPGDYLYSEAFGTTRIMKTGADGNLIFRNRHPS